MADDILFPTVQCPAGPHRVVPVLTRSGSHILVVCPAHEKLLNGTQSLEIRWLTEEEINVNAE